MSVGVAFYGTLAVAVSPIKYTMFHQVVTTVEWVLKISTDETSARLTTAHVCMLESISLGRVLTKCLHR